MFAAFAAIGAYIAIPLPPSPVPIVLANMFSLLGALVLGPRWGALSVAIYLALGAIGLPVFSGGSGGLAKFAGPTGGYLVGYLAGAFAAGWVSRLAPGRALPRAARFAVDASAFAAGMVLVYLAGVPRLKMVLGSGWERAIAAGLLPFLFGDAVKAVVAALLAPLLRNAISEIEGRGADV